MSLVAASQTSQQHKHCSSFKLNPPFLGNANWISLCSWFVVAVGSGALQFLAGLKEANMLRGTNHMAWSSTPLNQRFIVSLYGRERFSDVGSSCRQAALCWDSLLLFPSQSIVLSDPRAILVKLTWNKEWSSWSQKDAEKRGMWNEIHLFLPKLPSYWPLISARVFCEEKCFH